MRELQYDHFSAAWLFLFAFGIGWIFFSLYQYRQKALKAFGSESVLKAVLERREPVLFWLKVFLCILAWVFGVFALMDPKGNERYISTAPNGQITVARKTESQGATLRKKAHEVIFLIDASASMGVSDVSGKTRLEVAKEIADEVIRHLNGENVSVYAFTSATIQQVPSTLDYLFARLMVRQIKMNAEETEGTDIKQALEFLRSQYFSKESPKAKTLIILSDGGDTQLVGLDGEMRKQAIASMVSQIADAGEKNLHVFTVGLGSFEGKEVPGIEFEGKPVLSKVDESLLRRLSIAGRGELFLSEKMTPFQISQALNQRIFRKQSYVDTRIEASLPDRGERTLIYDFYFQLPLGLAILALMGCLLLPDTYKEKGKQ